MPSRLSMRAVAALVVPLAAALLHAGFLVHTSAQPRAASLFRAATAAAAAAAAPAPAAQQATTAQQAAAAAAPGTDTSFSDALTSFSRHFMPMSDTDEARFDQLGVAAPGMGRRVDRRDERRTRWSAQRPWATAASPSPAPVSGQDGSTSAPLPASDCLRIKDVALAALQSSLKASLEWVVQEGAVDFGFLGDQALADCKPNCGFTNPASPYGLTILPLAPSEAWVAKARAPSTPSYVADHLQSTTGGGSKELSQGYAPVYQLQQDEVVLVAGCAPSGEASRYFATTPYLYSTWSNDTQRWLTVFGSMGDSRSLVPISTRAMPDPPAPEAPPVATTTPLAVLERNSNASTVFLSRLATAMPPLSGPAFPLLQAFIDGASQGMEQPDPGIAPRIAAASTVASQASMQQGQQAAAASKVTATPPPPAGLAIQGADAADMFATWFAAAAASNSTSPGNTSSPSPTPVQAGAPAGTVRTGFTRRAAGLGRAARLAAAPQAAAQGPQQRSTADTSAKAPPVQNQYSTGSPFDRLFIVAMTASHAAAQRIQAALAPALSLLQLPETTVNVLPIPAGFTSNMGLDERSPYYMLLHRNIVPRNQLGAFVQYADTQPIRVWRLTPRTALRVTAYAERSAGAGSSANTGTAAADAFPTPSLLPREAFPPQSEAWLLPAFNHLLERIHTLFGEQYALAYSLVAGSALGTLGVDWGKDCVDRGLDYCNGDNRDAQYLSTFPFIRLDTRTRLALVVGVRHTATGLASYFNVAASDPVQRLGIADFDDSEVTGSARQYLVGGPYAHLSDYLYVAMFARDCQGLPYCKEVPSEGPRSAPLTRDLALTLRAYVNPLTGVGPSAQQLVMYRTVTLVPKTEAKPSDSRPAVDPAVLDGSPCMGALLGHTQCLQGANTPCCLAARDWQDDGCWCSPAGRTLQDSLSDNPLAARSMLASVNRMCRVPGRPQLACGSSSVASPAAAGG